MSSGSISSSASIASTPTAVVSVPPAFTVGRFHRRNATVTSPRRIASRVGIGNSIAASLPARAGAQPTSNSTVTQWHSAPTTTRVWNTSWWP